MDSNLLELRARVLCALSHSPDARGNLIKKSLAKEKGTKRLAGKAMCAPQS